MKQYYKKCPQNSANAAYQYGEPTIAYVKASDCIGQEENHEPNNGIDHKVLDRPEDQESTEEKD